MPTLVVVDVDHRRGARDGDVFGQRRDFQLRVDGDRLSEHDLDVFALDRRESRQVELSL